MLESWYFVINLHLNFDVLPAAEAATVVAVEAVTEAVAVEEFFGFGFFEFGFFVFGFAFGFFNVFMVDFSFPLRYNILICKHYF